MLSFKPTFSLSSFTFTKKLFSSSSLSAISVANQTTVMYHLTPVRIATIKKSKTINTGEGVQKRKPSYTVGGNANYYSHYEKLWRFLKKLEIELPYDPEIPLLGIHTEETRIERDTCTLMFIAALFTIARTWKPRRYPSADEWIRRFVVHVHNGIVLSYKK